MAYEKFVAKIDSMIDSMSINKMSSKGQIKAIAFFIQTRTVYYLSLKLSNQLEKQIGKTANLFFCFDHK